MADKAKGKVSASILTDNVKSKMSGSLDSGDVSLDVGTGEGWVYVKRNITTTSATLLSTSDDFFGGHEKSDEAGSLSTSDKINLICIKNTGQGSNGTSTSESVMFCLDGGTAAYGIGDGILLNSGECCILKPINTTINDLTIITTSSGGSSAGTGEVVVEVAAVIQNI